jgi:hypothetical protein
MATKTKAKPSNKAEEKCSYDFGRVSRENGEPITECPADDPYPEKWKQGWTEADNTIREAEAIDAAVKASEHNLDDPDVVEFGVDLAKLMQAFDNAGVSIVEEQFRALSPEQINQATKWANDSRTGQKRCVPEFLRQYATQELIAFSDGYLEAQEEMRKVLMKCRYGKPSPTKPEGDDGEPKIKMTCLVPLGELRPTTAEEIWGGMRCRVEFALKSVNQWQRELPGIEQAISCETEIRGYSRKMKDWQFSFLVSQELLPVDEAFDRFWKSNGSCRLTPIGEIQREAGHGKDSDDAIDATSLPDAPPNQLNLFDGKRETNKLKDKDGEFTCPDEYVIPMPVGGKKHYCVAYVGHGSNGRFYASMRLDFVDDDEESDLDYGNPREIGDGSVTAKEAVREKIGTLIDVVKRDCVAPNAVYDLQNELKRLETEDLIPMPEDEE